MKTIYVIMEHSGSYEDYSSWAVASTFDESIATNYVKAMEARLANRNSVQSQINQHMGEVWEKSNPRPHTNFNPAQKNLPNYGPKKSKWSTEQLTEYNSAKKFNEDNRLAAAKPYSDWARNRYAEMQRFTGTFSETDQSDLKNINHDSTWSIEEISFLE
jgi:hypothetical protein